MSYLNGRPFSSLMLPVNRAAAFRGQDDEYVWCGSAVQGEDRKYYLYYSHWPRSAGFNGWVICSSIGCARADSPAGPFTPLSEALPPAGCGWDAHCTHNPTILKHEGKYYLYYMGNCGDGSYWNHRNHQRVGVAVAERPERPEGPFIRFARPVMDVTCGAHDSLMTSNPTVTQMPDGRFIMVYKAVSDQGELPKGGAVVCGVAFADHPLGPFERAPHPIFVNPENDWSVEDPFVWAQDGVLWALAKDFQGYFTGAGAGCSTALFRSEDGLTWLPDAPALAYLNEITWADGEKQPVHRLERPQLLMDETGNPRMLYCACAEAPDCSITCNIAIPLRTIISD